MNPRFSHLSFVAAFLLSLVGGSVLLQAGASNKNGNPYGNGSFFPTVGTFTGVLRGVDLVGITQFSTGTTNSFTGGPLYIYNAASGVYDDTLGVYATLDPSGGTLNAFISSTTNVASSPTSSNNLSAGGGFFNASLSTQPPNQVFHGNGVITEIVNGSVDPVTTTNTSFSISGCRISN